MALGPSSRRLMERFSRMGSSSAVTLFIDPFHFRSMAWCCLGRQRVWTWWPWQLCLVKMRCVTWTLVVTVVLCAKCLTLRVVHQAQWVYIYILLLLEQGYIPAILNVWTNLILNQLALDISPWSCPSCKPLTTHWLVSHEVTRYIATQLESMTMTPMADVATSECSLLVTPFWMCRRSQGNIR